MSKFLRYLKIQCTRAVRHYPIILIFTVLLTVSIILFVHALFRSNDDAESRKKFEIGLVGDLSETYLDIGIVALKNLDSSQYYVELTEMKEEEAKEKLASGELHGYLLIPDGFVKSIVYGENKPLTYVSANSPATFGPMLTHEIVEIVSKLVIQGQNGIYGLIDIADIYDVSGSDYDDALLGLNVMYIDTILERENYYEHTYVGLGNGNSFKEYYICSFLILLLILWGMSCSALVIKHDMGIPRILKSNGYGLTGMVLGDYLPFLAMMCFNTFLLLSVGGIYLQIDGVELFLGIFPVIMMISALQFFLYEISSNIISGVLVQLFVAVILSYASGFFYPIYSLPQILQTCSSALPTGVAFDYLSEVICGKSGWEILPQVWLYGILFIVLSIGMRQYKIRSNKYD